MAKIFTMAQISQFSNFLLSNRNWARIVPVRIVASVQASVPPKCRLISTAPAYPIKVTER